MKSNLFLFFLLVVLYFLLLSERDHVLNDLIRKIKKNVGIIEQNVNFNGSLIFCPPYGFPKVNFDIPNEEFSTIQIIDEQGYSVQKSPFGFFDYHQVNFSKGDTLVLKFCDMCSMLDTMYVKRVK